MNYNDCKTIGSSLTGMPQTLSKTSTITDSINQLANVLYDVSRGVNEINYRLYGSCNNPVCENSEPVNINVENLIAILLENAEETNNKLVSIIERL